MENLYSFSFKETRLIFQRPRGERPRPREAAAKSAEQLKRERGIAKLASNFYDKIIHNLIEGYDIQDFTNAKNNPKKQKEIIETWLIRKIPLGGGFEKKEEHSLIMGTRITYFRPRTKTEMDPKTFGKMVTDIHSWLKNPGNMKRLKAKYAREKAREAAREAKRRAEKPGRRNVPEKITSFYSGWKLQLVQKVRDISEKALSPLIRKYVLKAGIADISTLRTTDLEKQKNINAKKFNKVANKYLKPKGFYADIYMNNLGQISREVYCYDKRKLKRENPNKIVRGLTNYIKRNFKA